MKKNVQVTPLVKSRLEELKTHLGLRSESQTIAYLATLYKLKYESLKVPEHTQCMEEAREIDRQPALF